MSSSGWCAHGCGTWTREEPKGDLGGTKNLLYPEKDEEQNRGYQIMFAAIPLRCSGATRWELRSQRSVMARKGRNKAPMAA